MKFIHYLENITGVGIYPLTSLMVFFIFFAFISTWALKANKQYIKVMKHIPFSEQETE